MQGPLCQGDSGWTAHTIFLLTSSVIMVIGLPGAEMCSKRKTGGPTKTK